MSAIGGSWVGNRSSERSQGPPGTSLRAACALSASSCALRTGTSLRSSCRPPSTTKPLVKFSETPPRENVLVMTTQSGLRSQTSTASFVVVSRTPASPSSLSAEMLRPPASSVRRHAILLLAALDLTATLALSEVICLGDVLLLSTMAVGRAVIVAAVGWSQRSEPTGAGTGWISGGCRIYIPPL